MSSPGQGEDVTLSPSQSPPLFSNSLPPLYPLTGIPFHWIRAPFLQLYFTLTVSNKEPITKFRHVGDLGLSQADSSTNTHALLAAAEGMETSDGVLGARKHMKEPHHVILQGTEVTDRSTERTQGLSPGP